MRIAGLLLAAGYSRRYGANKLLAGLPAGFPDAGTSVAVAAARHLVDALPDAIAVVRPRSQKLAQMLREAGCKTVVCRNASEGMGRSLAWGVRAADGADAWVVALADMPFIQPETIRRIAQALRDGAAIAAPRYRGARGHPVGFSRRMHGALLALSGDEGAKHVLGVHAELIVPCDVDDPGVLRDIDTPGDLAA